MSNSNLSVSSSNTLKEDSLRLQKSVDIIKADKIFNDVIATDEFKNLLLNTAMNFGDFKLSKKYSIISTSGAESIKIDIASLTVVSRCDDVSMERMIQLAINKAVDEYFVNYRTRVQSLNVEVVDNSLDEYRKKGREIMSENKIIIDLIKENHNYDFIELNNFNKYMSFGERLAKPLFSVDIKTLEVIALNNWVYSDKEFGESEISKIKSTIIQYLVSRHSNNDTLNKDILKDALPVIEDILKDINSFKKMLDDKINNN